MALSEFIMNGVLNTEKIGKTRAMHSLLKYKFVFLFKIFFHKEHACIYARSDHSRFLHRLRSHATVLLFWQASWRLTLHGHLSDDWPTFVNCEFALHCFALRCFGLGEPRD